MESHGDSQILTGQGLEQTHLTFVDGSFFEAELLFQSLTSKGTSSLKFFYGSDSSVGESFVSYLMLWLILPKYLDLCIIFMVHMFIIQW